MKAKLAVLGGGNTGCIMAAEFTLRGFDVTLYEDRSYWHEHIDDIVAKDNTVTVTGNDLTGDARIARITDDLQEALHDADIVFVAIVSWRHQEIIDKLKTTLREGQVVIFSAGNFASVRLRKALGEDFPVVVGEMMGNIFPCRMTGGNRAVIAMPLKGKMVAAFPAVDTPKLMEAAGQVFDCTPGKNVLDTAFNSPNVVIHVAVSLMNMANAEKYEHFAMYQAGLSPSVLKCVQAVENEKQALMEKMGYHQVSHLGHLEHLMAYGEYPELELFRSLEGPNSRLHRYINEDAYCGDCMILSLAERIGLEMPMLRAYMKIASCINDIDYVFEGITLDKLGVTGETPDEINTYLDYGK
ncbi:MAG: NAD/NADP octopine/nopaline dehydrogenase family protein [Butyricicoccus sp.]|nr:NAD/NADP octopine/nopaline dehydrogenase family protein [Butyricicoccus sp.]